MQTNRIDQLLGHKGAAIDLPFVKNNIYCCANDASPALPVVHGRKRLVFMSRANQKNHPLRLKRAKSASDFKHLNVRVYHAIFKIQTSCNHKAMRLGC